MHTYAGMLSWLRFMSQVRDSFTRSVLHGFSYPRALNNRYIIQSMQHTACDWVTNLTHEAKSWQLNNRYIIQSMCFGTHITYQTFVWTYLISNMRPECMYGVATHIDLVRDAFTYVMWSSWLILSHVTVSMSHVVHMNESRHTYAYVTNSTTWRQTGSRSLEFVTNSRVWWSSWLIHVCDGVRDLFICMSQWLGGTGWSRTPRLVGTGSFHDRSLSFSRALSLSTHTQIHTCIWIYPYIHSYRSTQS